MITAIRKIDIATTIIIGMVRSEDRVSKSQHIPFNVFCCDSHPSVLKLKEYPVREKVQKKKVEKKKETSGSCSCKIDSHQYFIVLAQF